MSKLAIEAYEDVINDYDVSKNTTKPILSRYEKAKLFGMRLEQLARGAIPTVDTKNVKSIQEIVELEFRERKMPLLVCRTLQNGNKEYFRLKDMIFS